MSQTTTDPITTDTDTTLVAAPGAGERTRINAIIVGISDEGTAAAILFENAANGPILFSMLAAQGPRVFTFPRPLVLAEGAVLNAATSGAATWHITVIHDERGQF